MAQASVTLKLQGGAANAARVGRSDVVIGMLRERANRVRNEAVRRCPVDTGALAGSITVEVGTTADGTPVARVGSNLPYALYVHEGTGIYGPTGQRIRPRNASVLRWPVTNNSGRGRRRYKGGKTARFAFAKSVKGSPPRPFLAEALRASGGRVLQGF